MEVEIRQDDANHVQRIHDPYLGQRWIVVCRWHGAKGRYKSRREAVAALKKYHGDCWRER